MKDPKLKLFEDNPDITFRLIAILDIDLKYPNYFFTLFEDIETGEQYIEKIIPELFRRRFKIGNHYKKSKLVKFGSYKQGIFEIEVLGNEKYKTFNAIGLEYPYTINKAHTTYFNKQLCYVFEYDDIKLVIPSNIIAIRYYFLSASVKKAYNSGNFDELYYPHSNKYFSKEDKCQIDVTTKVNKKDIPFVARFLDDRNPYTVDSFNYFKNNKLWTYKKFNVSKEDSFFSTLLCRFPVLGTYNIHCKYMPVKIDGADAYLVTDIYNDDSPLGFSKLYIRRYKKGTPPGDVDKVPFEILHYKGRNRGRLIDKTLVNTPSSGTTREEFLTEEVPKDLNTLNLNIMNENIYTGSGALVEINPDTVNTVPSFEDPDSLGGKSQEEIQKIMYRELDKLKEPFLLIHFIYLFEELRQNPLVGDSWISGTMLMTIIPRKSKSMLNKLEDVPRPYLYGYFGYQDKIVYFIEIQEDESWKQSTWFFVSDEKIEFDKSLYFSIIKKYIEKSKYTDLYDYCMDEFGMSLFLKKHTKNIDSEDHIDNWCEGIFELVDLTDDQRREKIFSRSKQ